MVNVNLIRFLFALLLGAASPALAQSVDSTTSELQLTLMGSGLHMNNWGAVTSANLQTLEAAVAGEQSFNITGGTLTLTQAQAASPWLVFNGTLSSAQTVILPTNIIGKPMIISNLTSGYSLTLQGSATGLATIVIPSGDSTVLAGNNTLRLVTIPPPPPIPPGTMVNYGGTIAPTSWAMCDGSAVSRTTYPVLFGNLATLYGAGDGSTTFNLPDARGRVMASPDGGTGRLYGWGLTAAGGEATHTLSYNEMPVHNHSASDSGHSHSDAGHAHIYQANNTQLVAAGAGVAVASIPTSGAATTTGYANIQTGYANISVGNAGAGWAHNVVQPTLVTNCIIKLY